MVKYLPIHEIDSDAHLALIGFLQKFGNLPKFIGSKLSTFCPFSASNILVTSLGAPKLGLYKPFIITHIVYKFQLYKPSGFWVINETINFQVKISRFFMFFFLCLNSQSRNL